MHHYEGNPELKEGYASIANETLDAIARTTLSDYESRCIHFLWRKTYGWKASPGHSKKTDAIAYSQWVDGTAIEKRSIRRTLTKLVNRKIITKQPIQLLGKNQVTVWGFQKHYKEWIGYEPKKEGADKPAVSYEEGVTGAKEGAVQPPEEGANQPPTITTKTNNTITIPCQDFANKLKNFILTNNPKAKVPADLTKWSIEFKRMIEIDKRSNEDIEKVINFSQKDPFWRTNILSASKLREKFDQLYMKAKTGGQYGTGSNSHKEHYSTALPDVYTKPEDVLGKGHGGDETAE